MDLYYLKLFLYKYNLLLGGLLADDSIKAKRIKTIQDRYSSAKQWYVYRSKCRHYSVIQVVSGRVTGTNKRCGKNWIESITGVRI